MAYITSLELENFKAFGTRQKVEFAPITLFFGQNSAGKSSILQALSLLKQTIESPDPNAVLLPSAKDGFVDLGSFRDLIFDHNINRELTMSIGLHEDGGFPRRFWKVSRDAELRVAYRLGLAKDGRETEVRAINVSTDQGQGQLSFFPSKLGKEDQRVAHRSLFRMARNTKEKRAQFRGMVAKDISYLTDEIEDLANKLFEERELVKNLLQDRFAREDTGPMSLFEEKEEKAQRSSASKAFEFYAASPSFEEIKERLTIAFHDSKLALMGLTPIPVSNGEESAPELRAIFGLKSKLARYDRIHPSYYPYQIFRSLNSALSDIVPTGPLRSSPERYHFFSGSAPSDVGYTGASLPDLLYSSTEHVKRANEWMEKLGIGYSLEVEQLSDKAADLFAMRLIDTKRKEPIAVGFNDVGHGISQVLPLIVQSTTAARQTLLIEQPEVHIHPGLQAELGGLFAECSQGKAGNRFIIETHSEHLILRLQKLIRKGELDAENLAIYCVVRGEEGSEIERIPIDKKGRFMREWPGGFFPERLGELR